MRTNVIAMSVAVMLTAAAAWAADATDGGVTGGGTAGGGGGGRRGGAARGGTQTTQVSGTVKSVSAAGKTITVTLENKTDKTFKMADTVSITFGGPIVDGIKAGDKVQVRPTTEGGDTARTITVKRDGVTPDGWTGGFGGGGPRQPPAPAAGGEKKPAVEEKKPAGNGEEKKPEGGDAGGEAKQF
jgi:hypothetical protein